MGSRLNYLPIGGQSHPSTVNAVEGSGEFNGMIGRAPCMQALFDKIRCIAPLDMGVLVQGESGTGKELVARAIHQLSHRSGKFIAVNCGAVAPQLLSSQLFGHERGSFTGATQSHGGFFEQAQEGTLFLDEITEMPTELQVYLLRVTETHTLTRVGGSREIPLDVRVIAASNRDMQQAIAEGDLRSDLYFRLLEFPLTVPPLRERHEDIALLAEYFIRRLNERYGTQKSLSEPSLKQLGLRSWSGNVRELQHVMHHQYVLSADAAEIEIDIEPEQLLQRRSFDGKHHDMDGSESTRPTVHDDTVSFNVGATLEDVERTVLLKTLAHCHNDKRQTARVLGVSLKTVYNKLERYRTRGFIGEDIAHDPR